MKCNICKNPMGNKKILYETEELALKEATENAEKYSMEFKAYPCPNK